TTGRAAPACLGDVPESHQLADGAGHGGLRIAGELSELRERHRSVLEQRHHDALQASVALRAIGCAWGHRRHTYYIARRKLLGKQQRGPASHSTTRRWPENRRKSRPATHLLRTLTSG